MLIHTFLHLPGIGAKSEQALWKAGVRTWDAFEHHFLAQRSLFPSDGSGQIAQVLDQSRKALQKGDFDFFAERLPKQEHFRIALADPSAVVFLDIETTGLSLYYDQTTVLGVGNLQGYRFHVQGGKLDGIAQVLREAKCIVTFNGTLFDLKFIRKEFPALTLPRAHIDLRFFARSVGLAGSQKKIEAELGLARDDDIKGVIGEKAPILWYKYRLGDLHAGRQLIEYNCADIEGMKLLLDVSLARHIRQIPSLPGLVHLPVFYGRSKSSKVVKWARTQADEKPGRLYLPPYRGKVGPKITYADLKTAGNEPLKVVGIDLTGSENRLTGWCLLVGDQAETRLLRTDQELIEETVRARPDLVSVDSPLSLPKGRIRASDDDPGRRQFGIMRECERILKKRGVNVYPCLINSMQGLTARGMRLAKEFRSRGVPVIESYPGAAQDIMGIPRKRAGLEYLKRGLGEFGVKGDFLTRPVTHDEVDAVTSAIVGLFFWGGKFERLGNPDEEYLIVPDLDVPPDPWQERLVIGVSGPIASGKTTGAKFLERQGFAYGRFSLVLARLLEEKGEPLTRQSLQRLGEHVNRELGQRWLCRKLVDALPAQSNLAIDGLRFPDDHAYLVESFGPAFFHLHVTAPEATRRARYVKDGNKPADFDRASAHRVEQQIGRLSAMADHTISNDSTERSYERKLARMIKGDFRLTRLPNAKYGIQ